MRVRVGIAVLFLRYISISVWLYHICILVCFLPRNKSMEVDLSCESAWNKSQKLADTFPSYLGSMLVLLMQLATGRTTLLMPISRRSHLVRGVLAILKRNGIVRRSVAKSSVGCGPVFNALWQQQESPSIIGYVIHCGLDSKSNIQWDGHAIIWDAESWPSGPVSRCPEETLAWLPKEVCCCLAEFSQMQSPKPMAMKALLAHFFLGIVGRDNCAFHATRRLAVN